MQNADGRDGHTHQRGSDGCLESVRSLKTFVGVDVGDISAGTLHLQVP